MRTVRNRCSPAPTAKLKVCLAFPITGAAMRTVHPSVSPAFATPPDRIVTSLAERRRTIIEVIRRAERHLSLSVFRCDDREVLAALADASGRGVAVDVIMTARAKGGRRRLDRARQALERGGARVRSYIDPSVKYHAKYLVADAGPAIVATANLTRKCFTRTFDAVVVTHDAAVVAGLHELMAADLAGRALPTSLTPRLVVGPEHARRQIESLIDAARFRIRLIDAKLSDLDIQARLERRRRAGVQVEILDSNWIGDLKSHGKVMLIDDRIAIIGSMALAPSSLDRRRELAITVDSPAAVASLARVFDAIATHEIQGVPTTPIPPQLVPGADRHATC